jgi:hypothetical protein
MRHQQRVLGFIASLGTIALCGAWTSSTPLSRSNVLSIGSSAVAATFLNVGDVVFAFDGSGSTAYTGRSVASKEELAKRYVSRLVADVKDFKALGNAIARGETDGDEWVAFFIPYQRREPDAVGRSFAAQLDLIGSDGAGGVGLLLAGSFGKKGKPIEALPQVRKFQVLASAMPAIAAAGKTGDAAKAKKAWLKASEAFSEYLKAVELPVSLSDPLYAL